MAEIRKQIFKRSSRTNRRQHEAYVQFLLEHPNFVAAKADPHYPNLLEDLWQTLSQKLNGQGPPRRTVDGWKKILRSWKNQVRSKARQMVAEMRATGGGIANIYKLSNIEERALEAWNSVSMLGDTDGPPPFGVFTTEKLNSSIEETPVSFSVNEINFVEETSSSTTTVIAPGKVSPPTKNTPNLSTTAATPLKIPGCANCESHLSILIKSLTASLEEQVENARRRGDIEKVQAEAQKVQAEAQKIQAEAQRVQAEAQKVQADAQKVQADAFMKMANSFDSIAKTMAVNTFYR